MSDEVISTTGARSAFKILHVGFVILPLIAGLDKFLGFLTDWDIYLAPTIGENVPVETFLLVVGAVEILAAIIVAVWPRIGGYLVAVWLWGIIVNLILLGAFYDIALRDFVLSLGAIALAQLATPPKAAVTVTDA